MKNHRLIRFLLAGSLALAAALRADEEQDLIAVLQSTASVTQKCAAAQRLRIVGTARSIAPLTALLGEERTSHASRYALEAMPYPEAGAALREGLGRTAGLIKAGLIDSLGWRGEPAAVSILVPLLTDADPTLASAAASALGRIAGSEAAAALSKVRDQAPPAVQPAVWEGLLRCAERCLANKDGAAAAMLYRSLFETHPALSFRMAAWRGLVLTDASQRPDLLAKALAGTDRSTQVAALQLLREIRDPETIRACRSPWTSLPAESQIAVLDAHLALGREALPTLRAASESPRLAVRVAAWQALASLEDPTLVPALAKAAALGDPAERDAARDTLSRLRSPEARTAFLSQIDSAEPAVKAELLRALGEHGDKEAAGILLRHVSAQVEPVRRAALESLRILALPDTLPQLLELAVHPMSDREREPVLKALYAVCRAGRDATQTSRRVVEALDRAPVVQRRQLLPVLAELGTPEALAAAQAATQDRDLELVREAVRVLSQWPNAEPAPHLLTIARTNPDSTVHTLALRGCIEVAGQEPDLTKRLALLRQAMVAAKRPDEKRQALSQIGQVPTREALQVLTEALAEEDLANEAGLAAVSVAEKLAPSNPDLADEAAAKVLARCQAPDIVKRAWALRRKTTTAGPFIRDWQICGPYSKPGAVGAQAVFEIKFGPENPGETVTWKPAPQTDHMNLAALFPDQANCVAYLRTGLVAPRDCEGMLLLGSDDGVKAWLNGTVVHSNNTDRGEIVDQDMAPIQLKQGPNELLLKITQGGGGWSVCARIVGPDGLPIADLRASAPLR